MIVRRYSAVLLLCLAFVASAAMAASPNVVISQVYGGGGATTGSPAYKHDYVELFNTSNAAVPLSGYSLQYGSTTGQFASTATNLYAFPAGTSIGAGKYLLVKLGQPGTVGPDFTGDLTTTNLSMAAGGGKVVLANVSTALNCGATATPCPLPDGRIVDLVAYGNSNNAEGGATVNNGATLANTVGGIRKSNGCQDTDNNNADFIVASVGGGLVPRTSATAAQSCGVVTDAAPTITAPANPIATVIQNAAPFNVGLTGSDDNSVYNWSATAGSGVSAVSVSAGQGTPNVTYNVTIQAGFTGTATFTASLSDNVNPSATRAVNIQVNPLAANNPPSITLPANPIATVAENAAAFTVGLTGSDDNGVFNWSASPGTGVSAVAVTAGQSTSSVTYSVTLQGGFNGTASFTATLSDNVNAAVLQTVNINVTAAPPVIPTHLVISQIYGGGGNSGAPYNRDFVELFNPTGAPIDTTGWTIQYASSTGTNWTNSQPLGGIVGPGEYFLIALASGANGSALPAANITGSINMSGTTGKLALVSNGDPLAGNCPLSDPDVVDFVGFGSSADCREGTANAPAPSNTTSIFRKNGGMVDDDKNNTDFVTGSPNPRRTAPFLEVGPSIVFTQPGNGVTNAPRDENISITFNENVDVAGPWYSITCVTTGNHNDATFTSVAGAGKTWVIIPNQPFINGEQCSVTIFKDYVHDQDLDDIGVNADTLPADYTWTFTTSTGTLPPFAASIHLSMGNPSGAVADTMQPNNYLMEKPEFALSYNRDRGTPNWVSWHLSTEWVGTLTRVDTFRADSAVLPTWYRVLGTDYSGSGFDRGHLVPNADRDKETSSPINQATFLMTNMLPQAPDNNQGPWADMENYLRTLLGSNELYIVAGGVGMGGTGSAGFANTIANGTVTVPAQTWKVVLMVPNNTAPGAVQASARTIAVIMPNTQGIRNNDWMNYIVSIDAVEALTGYDFFAAVPDAVENAIEAGINGTNPPGVANQSVSTNEDVATTFALNAAGSGSLTYTILSGPSHGTLSGSDGNRTYTPAPEYSGADSFTYRVSSGSLQSGTATVTITVLEVNDAPVAAADAKSTNEDTALTFAAADLTGNDNAGPAEAGQTLTVSSVGGSTNGTVSLNAGNITFSPAPNFNGAASFTYQVCDNGVTAGSSDPRCATGTVNVTVNAVNDAPSAAIIAPSTATEGTSITAVINVTDPDAGDSASVVWSVTKNGSPYANGSGTSVAFTADDNGAYAISATVTDGSNATANAAASVSVTNVAPLFAGAALSATAVNENGSVTLTGTFTDPGTADTHVLTVNWGDGSAASLVAITGGARSFSLSHQYIDDNPTGTPSDVYAIMLMVADDEGDAATTGTAVTVNNAAPAITATSGPTAALTLGAAATVNVSYTDAGSLDTHTATFTWDDGSTSTATCAAGTCSATHTFAAAGVYGVSVTVADDDTGSASTTFNYVIVTDPSAGAVTGGGWIESAAGRATFNLGARYHNGAATPTGNTQLKINATKFDFSATSYDWLVVSGANAQYRGTGTVNGAGNYGFLVTVADGATDKLRVRIWDIATGTTVYDNSTGSDDLDAANPQPIGAGSINIH